MGQTAVGAISGTGDGDQMLQTRVLHCPECGVRGGPIGKALEGAVGQVLLLGPACHEPPVVCVEHHRCVDHAPQIGPGPPVVGHLTSADPGVVAGLHSPSVICDP